MPLCALHEQVLIWETFELGLVFLDFHDFGEISANEIHCFLFQKGILLEICIGHNVDRIFHIDICPDNLQNYCHFTYTHTRSNRGEGGHTYIRMGGGGLLPSNLTPLLGPLSTSTKVPPYSTILYRRI